jgi:class 3 adenylate cyclase/heme exporter protein D
MAVHDTWARVARHQLTLFRAKLSWRITLALALSALGVSLAVLVPVLDQRRAALDREIETLGQTTLAAFLSVGQWQRAEAWLGTMKARQAGFPIRGFTVLREGEVILGPIGSVPSGSAFDLAVSRVASGESLHTDGVASSDKAHPADRLVAPEPIRADPALTWMKVPDLASSSHPPSYAVIHLNTAPVGAQLRGFAFQMGGFTLLLTLTVTVVAMIALNRLVIDPIFRLRQALQGVMAARHQRCGGELRFHCTQLDRADELGDVMRAFDGMDQEIADHLSRLEQREHELQDLVTQLDGARDQAESLLFNILPSPIAHRLQSGERVIADAFPEATVLFADLVGFTRLASQLPADRLVCLLNDIFTAFDEATAELGLEKVKTIGDAYMAVGGVPTPRPDHAEAMAELALRMQGLIPGFADSCGEPLRLRIGIHSGPVIAGVIGVNKRIYDLWGDTVNIASRLESHGMAGAIQIGDRTYAHLSHAYTFEPRGLVELKGRGAFACYFLTGRNPQKTAVNPTASAASR